MSEIMEGKIRLLDGMAFKASAGSGHEITLDAAPAVGGRDWGTRPIELLLLGLGGCTAMDVISILRKMRQDVKDYAVRVRGERRDDHPRVFTAIAVEHVVMGRGLSPDAVRRAIELSANRYCAAAAMLGKATRIEESYVIIDQETAVETTGTIGVVAAAA